MREGRRKEGRKIDRKLSANQRPNEMTHPFRLKVLLVYDFNGKLSAGGALEGQLHLPTHTSETHTHTHTRIHNNTCTQTHRHTDTPVK